MEPSNDRQDGTGQKRHAAMCADLLKCVWSARRDGRHAQGKGECRSMPLWRGMEAGGGGGSRASGSLLVGCESASTLRSVQRTQERSTHASFRCSGRKLAAGGKSPFRIGSAHVVAAGVQRRWRSEFIVRPSDTERALGVFVFREPLGGGARQISGKENKAGQRERERVRGNVDLKTPGGATCRGSRLNYESCGFSSPSRSDRRRPRDLATTTATHRQRGIAGLQPKP